MTLVRLTPKASNGKTGPIPVSTTSSNTCPDACPLKAKGCYAKGGPIALVWKQTDTGKHGTDWNTFCGKIASLPEGTLWRHNQAGDLPGEGDLIDVNAMHSLVEANRGRRGFTYTHKPVVDDAVNREVVAIANANGFTVNLSANTLDQADTLSDLNIAPVVVILDLPEGVRHDVTTPAGRKVATCPATYRDDVTCASCGLCQHTNRKVIVGFPAHGYAKKSAAAVTHA